MADERILELERAAATGDEVARKKLHVHRRRSGLCMTCGSKQLLPNFRNCFHCLWQSDVVIPEVLAASPGGRGTKFHLHSNVLHRTACSVSVRGPGRTASHAGDWVFYGLPLRLAQITCKRCVGKACDPNLLSALKVCWDGLVEIDPELQSILG